MMTKANEMQTYFASWIADDALGRPQVGSHVVYSDKTGEDLVREAAELIRREYPDAVLLCVSKI